MSDTIAEYIPSADELTEAWKDMKSQNDMLRACLIKVTHERDDLKAIQIKQKDPVFSRRDERMNNKHVKDALGHLRHVEKVCMSWSRWSRVFSAKCQLEEWEKMPQ
jgi:hypothetical protein